MLHFPASNFCTNSDATPDPQGQYNLCNERFQNIFLHIFGMKSGVGTFLFHSKPKAEWSSWVNLKLVSSSSTFSAFLLSFLEVLQIFQTGD